MSARGGAAVKLVVVGDDAGSRAAVGRAGRAGRRRLRARRGGRRRHPGAHDRPALRRRRPASWTGSGWPATSVRRRVRAGRLPGAGRAHRSGLSVSAVAGHHEVDATELYRSVRRALEQTVLRRLRRSPTSSGWRCCGCARRVLGRGDVDVAERRGGPRLAARRAGARRASCVAVSLFTPGRPAQRPPAAAVAGPLAAPGRPVRAGLRARPGPAGGRPPAAGRGPGRLLLLEGRGARRVRAAPPAHRRHRRAGRTLRGRRCCPPELVTDEARGLPAYSALQLRVADEVRDRRRPTRTRRWCGSASGWRRSGERRDRRPRPGDPAAAGDRGAARRRASPGRGRGARQRAGGDRGPVPGAVLERARDGAAGGLLLGGGFGAGQEPPARAPRPAGPGRRLRGQPRRDQQGDAAARPGQGVPGRRGLGGRRRPARPAIAEAAAELDLDGPAYAELLRWAARREST